jgi:hypothetical protein
MNRIFLSRPPCASEGIVNVMMVWLLEVER